MSCGSFVASRLKLRDLFNAGEYFLRRAHGIYMSRREFIRRNIMTQQLDIADEVCVVDERIGVRIACCLVCHRDQGCKQRPRDGCGCGQVGRKFR